MNDNSSQTIGLHHEECSELDAGDFEDRSSLHLACMDGNLDLVRYFISIGADVNAKNRCGQQPLDITIRHGHIEITKVLQKSGAEMSINSCADVRHRLFRSAAEGDVTKLRGLVESGLPVNSFDYDDRTLLHLAAANGHYEMVSFLLSSGVDVRCKDRHGRDALDEAMKGGHFRVEEALRHVLSCPRDQDMKQVKGLNLDSIGGTEPVLKQNHLNNQQSGPCLTISRSTSIATMSDIYAGAAMTENEIYRAEDLDLVETPSFSDVAQYLIAKGSKVDADIRWRSTLHIDEHVPPPNTARTNRAKMDGAHIDKGECGSSCRPGDRGNRQSCISEQQDDYKFMCLADESHDPHDLPSIPAAKSLRLSQPHFQPGKEVALRSRSESLQSISAQCSWSCSGLGSLYGTPSSVGLGSAASMRLSNYVAAGATVLLIDIKGFTAGCAEMTAAEVGEWVADFYAHVDTAAAVHGVRKVEVRGDCCICVSGVGPEIPLADAGCEAADGRGDQVTRMLAFTADLHAELATLAYRGGRGTSARMGMATGDVAFLVGEGGGGGRGFVSVQGDVVKIAARMEALSEPGTVLAHRSAVNKWVAEGAGRAGAGRAAPATMQVECGDKGPQEAAVYDCARGAFRPPRPVPDPAPLRPPPRTLAALRSAAGVKGSRLCGAKSLAADAAEPQAKRKRSQSLT